MKRKTTVMVALFFALIVIAVAAPAALAKSPPVVAEGDWVWVGGEGGTDRVLPSGSEFLKNYEIGQWEGTFTAADTYEPYVAMVNRAGELWAKLWIHFDDAAVDMGGGVVLHGDMTVVVIFHAGVADAGWRIHNGTGDLQQLGGKGTLVWTETGMHYTGTVWTNK